MRNYTHILAAVDFSAASAHAAKRAADMASRYGARLSLIHVVEFMPLDPMDGLMIGNELELQDTAVETATARLRDLALELGVNEDDSHVELGSPKNVIAQWASELDVDLVVVGSHGHHGLARLLGSTAASIVQGAPCDVLAVRAEED